MQVVRLSNKATVADPDAVSYVPPHLPSTFRLPPLPF